MSGYQPNPYPESSPALLTQSYSGSTEDWEDDPEREPMGLGEKVGMVFMWAASIAIVVGGLHWLLYVK